MNAVLRQTIVVSVAILFAVSLLGLRSACAWTDMRKVIEAALRDQELEQLRRPTYHRIDARKETVRELIAQRCSMSQALAHFGELDSEHPDVLMELSRKRSEYDSDTERNYQYIVELVKDLLEDKPGEAAVALRRLEKQYPQLGAGR